MKKLLLLGFIIFAGFNLAKAQSAEFKFEKEVHDFGKIKEGVVATYDFKFTNVGDEPLIITNVTAPCGCTIPKWTKEPVKKGETGIVTVSYNSAGRPMPFNKNVTITSNSKTPSKVLYIKGEVEPAAKPAGK
ncbi:DUF1573 domain-containing protein [Solitalea sp. MAHUQ-68]|uniref:DUF1573 domain-containing protein n=1 Tax=Solitalea agri TaxID=2953739 RepID=A0A9X2JBV0_9SPHI|nr:DUF1573 domain-containing protein [Solitalea agri]MCO4292373.1 DUF1573 domain-containing protein [Solitalea agri]